MTTLFAFAAECSSSDVVEQTACILKGVVAQQLADLIRLILAGL